MTSQEQAHVDQVRQTVQRMFGRDSVYVAMWGVQLTAAAVFTPFMTRVLGSTQFGNVAVALAVMQVLFALTTVCLQSAVQREYAEPGGDSRARGVLMLAILVAVAATGAVFATGPLWSSPLGLGGFGPVLEYTVLWAGAAAMTDAALGLLRSRDRIVAFSGVSLIQSVVGQAAGLVLVLTVSRSAAMYVLGQLLAQLAALLLALGTAPPRRLALRDLPLCRRALVFAVPLLPSAVAAFVLGSSDRLIVRANLGDVQVGRYQVAYNIGALSISLLTVLNMVWMPHVFRTRGDPIQERLLVASRDAVRSVLLPVVLGMTVAAPLVLRLWVPASYRPDGLMLVVAIVVVTSLPYAGSLAHTRVLLATGRTGLLAWSMLAAALVNIGLNLLLVPLAGLEGSATATLLSYVALSYLNRAAAHRLLPLEATSSALFLSMYVTAACAIGSVAIPTTPWWLGVRAAVAMACLAWFAKVVRDLTTGSEQPVDGLEPAVVLAVHDA